MKKNEALLYSAVGLAALFLILVAANYLASLAAFHNHPSGDPTPSQADVDVTARLLQAGHTMGVDLVDHIILGAGCYYSFQAERRLR